MSSSYEKLVKGATKIKVAPPKSKYIEPIIVATHGGEAGVKEVLGALLNRLRDSTWTVVFKSLITVHIMIREGCLDVTLAYLSRDRDRLAISSISEVQTQGRNIQHYSNYLTERARGYKDTKCDYVRAPQQRLEKLSVDKGLLRETETVQHQITALLKCDVFAYEPQNEITIMVFRMLVLDLLPMFTAMNQGIINILTHFFEMSRPDAERALGIYRNFTKQADFVVGYLGVARRYAQHTRIEVTRDPNHAPVNLVRQLEEYVNDSDFEANRRKYLAEQNNKKFRGSSSKTSTVKLATEHGFPDVKIPPKNPQPTQQASKTPAPDLIDFFDAIEQPEPSIARQQDMQVHYAGAPFQTQQQPQTQPYQQTGFIKQFIGFQNQSQPLQQDFQTGFGNGVLQQQQMQQPQQIQQPQVVQTNFAKAGYGGHTLQPFSTGSPTSIAQDTASNLSNSQSHQLAPIQTAQSTNPFRQSMLTSQNGGPSGFPESTISPITRQSTNPFAKSLTPTNQQPFSTPIAYQLPQSAPLMPTATGKNPFAKNLPIQSPQTSGGLAPQPTGNTNPFRQSHFLNTNTGMGWQNSQQAIGGGLDHLDTVTVFPRPVQQQAWQQGG